MPLVGAGLDVALDRALRTYSALDCLHTQGEMCHRMVTSIDVRFDLFTIGKSEFTLRNLLLMPYMMGMAFGSEISTVFGPVRTMGPYC